MHKGHVSQTGGQSFTMPDAHTTVID
jgi:hypothetical protein